MSRLPQIALAAALLVGAPTAALAQGSIQFSWNSGSAPVRVAYDQGFQRGQRAGLDDARRGDRFGFEDESDFRRGDAGYRSQDGTRDRYRDSFRVGFEAGYRTGYGDERVARLPYGEPGRGPGYYDNRPAGRADLAYTNGFNDGYSEGQKDARDRHRFDPIAESRYRSGDHGYKDRYGNKNFYRDNYRIAFREGYERGYGRY